MKSKRNNSRLTHRQKVGYVMLAPFVTCFTLFTVIPVVVAIALSFTNYNMMQSPTFVLLNNYKLLLLGDRIFLTALKNTFVFALIVGPCGYLLSFFAAWVLNQFKFRNFFALCLYIPSVTSSVAISSVWKYIFSSDRYGFINNILIEWGFIDEPILWISDPEYIMKVVVIISLWMSMGGGFLVFLAGLQNCDKSLYEAGLIDGVGSRWQELKYLTLPQMKPQLLYGAITTISGSFGVFDVPVAVAGLPSPNYSAHTIVAHLYDYAFQRFQMGYASAVATVLFVITYFVGRVVMNALSEDGNKRTRRNRA